MSQPALSGRATRATTRAAASSAPRQESVVSAGSPTSPTSSYSSRTTSTSPTTTRVDVASSITSGSEEPEDHARSCAPTPVKKEKAKRSRVSPEQLLRLEELFTVDKAPTAARRKDISEILGMQERQTQVWFQNRRAKAKVQDLKRRRPQSPPRAAPTALPLQPPPRAQPLVESALELYDVVGETEQSSFIPCHDLSIGAWRRISPQAEKQQDLLAYHCTARRSLTWFVQSAGSRFKMEVSYDSVLESKFVPSNQGKAMVTLILSRPPDFFLHDRKAWRKSVDWTEDQQASNVLRHNVLGNAPELLNLLDELRRETVTSVTHIVEPQLLPQPTSMPDDPIYPGPQLSMPQVAYSEPEAEVYSQFIHSYDDYAVENTTQAIPRQFSAQPVPPTFYSSSVDQTGDVCAYQPQQSTAPSSLEPQPHSPSPSILTTPYYPPAEPAYVDYQVPNHHHPQSSTFHSQDSSSGLGYNTTPYHEHVYPSSSRSYATEVSPASYADQMVYSNEHGTYDAHGYYVHHQ